MQHNVVPKENKWAIHQKGTQNLPSIVQDLTSAAKMLSGVCWGIHWKICISLYEMYHIKLRE